jgi:glycosidase
MNSFLRRISISLFLRKMLFLALFRPSVFATLLSVCLLGNVNSSRGEAMLELFNVSWPDLTKKMPEIAEAGYDSLWLPNPAKGNSGIYSYGYDQFDPFDLGSTNQQGTVATRWGTQDQLIQMVQTAHRFGIRVYFDNVMNHRSSTVPGYPGSGTPTNYYPGLVPGDFHLQTVSGGYQNWPSVGDPYWCTISVVQNQPLLGLCDLAQEPGTVNWNFGNNIGDTTNKPVFVRFPNRPDLYMDTNSPFLGTGWGGNGWHGFNGTNGQPVAEDVSVYLCRAVAWTLYTTKCDGFRLDAVKHVPSSFFGNNTGQTDDPFFAGYTGAIQAMYDYVHGYGSNVTGNGYVETDGNRNSLFDTEAPRNDAMIFGEHISPAPDFFQYLGSGMRLENQPLYSQMNNSFNGGSSVTGMDGRDYAPSYLNCDGSGNYSAAQGVNFAMNQDYGYNANLGLEDAYLFLREGLPMVYSDGFNHNYSGGTPVISYANYLGEFGDNTMPETMYLHNQLARGGTRPRWSDQNIIAFERYDYRDVNVADPYNDPDATVVLFAMNTKTSFPGDEYFVDGVNDILPQHYSIPDGANGDMQGLAVGFPPGSVLHQLATSTPGDDRTFSTVTVRPATNDKSAASSSTVYVGNQSIPPGGGAIEIMIPSGGWVMYGYQWPEASRANASTNAIILRQNGVEVPHINVYRTDGTNGDSNYNPLFPFKMRGSVDPSGSVIGGVHVSNLTYAIDFPIVTNANFDILVRSDASCSNTFVKLDGGIDLNSQMGLGPNTGGTGPTGPDLRDNKPGYVSDVFLGYEQTALQFRNGPEKFAAQDVARDNVTSFGAETYCYTVNGTNVTINGSGNGANINTSTATWVYHDPTATNSAAGTNNTVTQRMPLSPTNNQPVDIYVKAGYQFQINTCFIYYTTDGSNPEGAFGIGRGTTQVVQAYFINHDSADTTIDWWKGTIPAQPDGIQVRYQVALFNGGSVISGQNILPISDADNSKLYGINQAAITNFNPITAVVWLHNDLNTNNTTIGLQSGFHILRARTFLPRTGKSGVYSTFLQTFYYDGALPTGVIAFPANGDTIGSTSYTVVIRADSTVTGVDLNIQDSASSNDDLNTGQPNGNGNDSNNEPIFVPVTPVAYPDPALSAQYPNYPQEFRYVYNNIPSSGPVTIFVRLKEFATSVYTNRYTMLTATANTRAPVQVVQITSPATDGSIITMTSNTTYFVQTCFTSTLDTNDPSLFTLTINGVPQPSSSFIFRSVGSVSGCPGLRSLFYNWTANSPGTMAGTNVIQVVYSNSGTGVTLSDTRTVVIPPPLRISGLTSNNQLLIWDSAPGVNYQVLATTNLALPFTPISGVIPGTGTSTFYYDYSTTNAPQKFYEIEAVP